MILLTPSNCLLTENPNHNQMEEKDLKQIQEELEAQMLQAEGKVESLKEMIKILEDKLK